MSIKILCIWVNLMQNQCVALLRTLFHTYFHFFSVISHRFLGHPSISISGSHLFPFSFPAKGTGAPSPETRRLESESDNSAIVRNGWSFDFTFPIRHWTLSWSRSIQSTSLHPTYIRSKLSLPSIEKTVEHLGWWKGQVICPCSVYTVSSDGTLNRREEPLEKWSQFRLQQSMRYCGYYVTVTYLCD